MKYFDYAATTPINKDVLNTYVKVSENYYAHAGVNPDVERLENDAKEIILEKLSVKSDEFDLIFTSGGSEANNLAVKGHAFSFDKPMHFIVSSYEHSSMHESFEYLESVGHEVTYVKPNSEGIIQIKDVTDAVKDNTVMVSIMHINNEIGTTNPVELIMGAVKLKSPRVVTLVDNVQGVGKAKNLDLEYIDLMTCSAHKIYGPKGIGALIKRKKLNLVTQIHGGALQGGTRGGTQNLAAQVAFAKACKDIIQDQTFILSTVDRLRDFLIEELVKNEKITLNAPTKSNVVSIRIDMEMQSESVVKLMLDAGYAISTKSACSSKLNKGSRSLNSIGLSMTEQDHTFRISISHHTSREDISGLVQALNKIIAENN